MSSPPQTPQRSNRRVPLTTPAQSIIAEHQTANDHSTRPKHVHTLSLTRESHTDGVGVRDVAVGARRQAFARFLHSVMSTRRAVKRTQSRAAVGTRRMTIVTHSVDARVRLFGTRFDARRTVPKVRAIGIRPTALAALNLTILRSTTNTGCHGDLVPNGVLVARVCTILPVI